MNSTTFDEMVAAVDKPVIIKESGNTFWRKEDPEIDSISGAVIKGGMFAHQRKWWDSKAFIKVLVGGYGSGKSFILGKRLIALALQNAPCPVASVSPTFPMARKTMVITLQQLLSGKQTLYGNQFWWKYNKSVHEFIIKFKGRTGKVLIQSGEDPDSLKGPNLAAAGMDEPFLMQEAVLDQMMARVRHPDATVRELCLSGTPESLGFGYDLCFGERYERLQKVGVKVEHVQASTRANSALGRDYIARLEGTFTDKAAQAYIDGAFVNLSEGLVYYGFSGMGGYSVKTEPSIPAGATLICGMDFNVNPMAAVVGWKYGEHVHYFDEIELPNADTEYMCQVLREKYVDWKDERNVLRTKFKIAEQYNPHYALREIYPDASGNKRASSAPGGKSDFTFIRQAGFEVKCKEANPARKDRYNSVNGKFKPRSGPPTLTVEPSCKRLIRYLQTYSHELMNTEDQKKMSHLLDACGYPIAFLFPIHHEHLYVRSLSGH